MSLLCNVRNSSRNYFTYLFVRLMKHRKKSMSVEFDALDVFTTQLVQEKSNKWDNMKIKNKIATSLPIRKVESKCQILEDITRRNLSDILREAIDENNPGKIITILETCKSSKTVPFELMPNILSYFAQTGHIDGIEYIRTIYEETNPTALQVQANLQQYVAEAIWIRGNIPKALTIFSEVYRNNSLFRRHIRLVLRHLFYNTVQKNSEASMVAILKFTEDLVNEFRDYTPMVNLWKICFLSEWYSDQVLAVDLLDRYKELLQILLPEVPHIVVMALKYHKTESVYKLLEILLKYDRKEETSVVLVALFDYKFRQRDLYSCSQILQWSTKYNILLPAIQQEKALQLLLNIKVSPTTKTVTKRIQRKDYVMKF